LEALMNQRLRCMYCMLWGAFLFGCDRHPEPPPAAPTAAAAVSAPAQPPRPTTQELLSGPYKTIVLPGMPLSVQAPQSWKIDVEGPLTFLQGPTPTDDAMIQLAQRETRSSDQVENLLAGAKHDQEMHPDTVKLVDMREMGDTKVLEQLSISRPITTPKVDAHGDGILDEHGNLQTVTTTTARWKFSVLVPYQNEFSDYELNFIDLSGEQYAADKDFLEKIMSSLRTDGSVAPASTTAQ
jgi:hypothetical protein